MKRLSFLALIVALSGCNYQSEEEARNACENWKQRSRSIVESKMDESPPVREEDSAKEYERDLREINASDRPETKYSRGDWNRWVISKQALRQFAKEAYEARKRIKSMEFDSRQKEFDKKADKIGYFYCRREESTRQYLGYKGKSGQQEKIVKHFRY